MLQEQQYLGKVMRNLLLDLNCIPEKSTVCTNMETVHSLVSKNAGISLLPEVSVFLRRIENVNYYMFNDPTLSRTVAAVYKKNNPKLEDIELFVQCLKDYIRGCSYPFENPRLTLRNKHFPAFSGSICFFYSWHRQICICPLPICVLFFLHAERADQARNFGKDDRNMNTRITELFGIKYPILQSGMQWLATPELAAAVSKAGGLGIISATIFMVDSDPAATKAGLAAGLAKCRELADGHPFGLNISMLPHADYDNNTELFFRTAYEEHVPVIETSGNNPQAYYELLRGWEKEDGRDNEHDKIRAHP